MENNKEQPKTTFDRIKAIEELKKKQLIAKILNKIKGLAREVLENKELCNLYLQEIEEDETERKRIIDWINNLPDVTVDEDRKKELKDRVKVELKERKKEVEEKISREPEKYLLWKAGAVTEGASSTITGGATSTITRGTSSDFSATSWNANLCNSSIIVS